MSSHKVMKVMTTKLGDFCKSLEEVCSKCIYFCQNNYNLGFLRKAKSIFSRGQSGPLKKSFTGLHLNESTLHTDY